MEQFDINTEYERIFGTSDYPTLYDSQDEEYIQLRRQIVGTVYVSYLSSKLPFENICDRCDNSYLPNSICGETVVQIPTNNHLSYCYDVVRNIRNHTVDLLMGILSSISINHPTTSRISNVSIH